MFIAKMTTRYPEYHGTGYYNFIIEKDYDVLNAQIQMNSHDFMLVGITKTRHQHELNIVHQYPNKADLNAKYFNEGSYRDLRSN